MKAIALMTLFLFLAAGCSSGSKSSKTMKDDAKGKATQTMDKAKEAMAKGGDSVTCSMKKDSRTIDVKKADKGCELVYTKFGNSEILATSAYGTSHCQKVADRIRGNLENAGFKCE